MPMRSFRPISVERQRAYFEVAYRLQDWNGKTEQELKGEAKMAKSYWDRIINTITVRGGFPCDGTYLRHRRYDFLPYWKSLLVAMRAVLLMLRPEPSQERECLLQDAARRDLPLTRQWLFVVTGERPLALYGCDDSETAITGPLELPEPEVASVRPDEEADDGSCSS